jgi:hypothetical protein
MRPTQIVMLGAVAIAVPALLAAIVGGLGWVQVPIHAGLAVFLIAFGIGKSALAVDGLMRARLAGATDPSLDYAWPWLFRLWISFKAAAGVVAMVAGLWLWQHPEAFRG